MSVKKNLTMAGLAALLAIPALGVHSNAHAAYYSPNNGVMLTNSEAKMTNPQYVYRPYVGHGAGIGQGASGPVFGQRGYEDDSIGHYNGHSFHFPDNGGWIVTQLDGKSNPSLAEVNAALYGTDNNGSGTASSSSNQSQNDNSSDQNQQSSSDQYSSIVYRKLAKLIIKQVS